MDRRRASAGRPRGDLLACCLLVAIPVLIYGIPPTLGHPNLPGDDLLQNFPLRVLVGRQLSQGTFPTFDPYIWGGAPLLGGWNAGALYPFTVLFAFLPPSGAWAINEMTVYWVGGLGLYAFLRTAGLRPLSCWLGAAAFAFSGALDVQLVHFGLVAGMSWVPLILLSLVKLTRDLTRARRATWIAALGVAGAMSVLAGEPRAIDTMLIVVVVYFAWLAIRHRGNVTRFVGSTIVGAIVATLISAAQWLPGAMAVSTSQRAAETYALFSAGSLYPRWLSLLFVPSLLGGSGTFGTSSWFVSYSLPEVMGYAGLFAVTAAFGLLGTLRRRRPLPDWLVWEVMAVVGILLALGGKTPLGHLLVHLPLFGGQRLQSRNIAVTDIALAVLLAYWVEEVLCRRVESSTGLRGWIRPDRFQVLSLMPLGVAGALSAATLASPDGVAQALGATASQATNASGQRPLFVLTLILVLAATAFIVGLPRLRPTRRAWVLGAIALADLAAFNLTSLWPIAVGPARVSNLGSAAIAPPSPASPALLHLEASLGVSNRYAIYNPHNYNIPSLGAIQVPDLNLAGGRFSMQGYSSIVDAAYAAATGSHAANGKGLETLSPSAIANGVLNQMDTATLITLPLYLVVEHSPGGAVPNGSVGTPPTGIRTINRGGRARWIFGRSLDITSFSLPLTTKLNGQRSPGGWSVGLIRANGSIAWQTSYRLTQSAHSIEVKLLTPSLATGLVLGSRLSRGSVGPPTMTTRGGDSYTADGDLADALASGWSFAGDLGQYACFTNGHAVPVLTVHPAPGRSIGDASVRALSGPAVEPTSATVNSPNGVEVVRSVTLIPGWSATWHPDRGPTRPLTVKRYGLVQSVVVPAGRGVVTWTYNAPGVTCGIALTLVGIGGLCVLLGLVISGRARGKLGVVR
jgi:hypothetical protein